MSTTIMRNFKIIPIAAILLSACTGNSKTEKGVTGNSRDTTVSAPAPAAGGWKASLADLQAAASAKRVSALKSFFDFPVNGDTTQIWDLVHMNEEEVKHPENSPEPFTERHFERYANKVFDPTFVKSLSLLDINKLSESGETETALITDQYGAYQMFATFDKALNALQLNVSFKGGTDENGEYVSEGESAVIYFFRIGEGGQLKFEKVLFAG